MAVGRKLVNFLAPTCFWSLLSNKTCFCSFSILYLRARYCWRANLVLMDFLVNPSWKSDSSKFVSTAEYLTFLNCSSEFKLETVCGSTAFLIGPEQQMRMMLDPVRIFATAIYIGCVVLALICALWVSLWFWMNKSSFVSPSFPSRRCDVTVRVSGTRLS